MGRLTVFSILVPNEDFRNKGNKIVSVLGKVTAVPFFPTVSISFDSSVFGLLLTHSLTVGHAPALPSQTGTTASSKDPPEGAIAELPLGAGPGGRRCRGALPQSGSRRDGVCFNCY